MADNKETETSINATSNNTKKLATVSANTLTIQEEQLSILKDISNLVKNISDNIFAGLVATLPSEAMELLMAPRATPVDALAEKEKEREGKLGAKAGDKNTLDSLKKLFDEYFGIFKTVFNVLKVILIPMILGFILGFRKKFDLLTVALTVAILYPIRTFKFMIRVFGFLFEALKFVGKQVSKIGPVFKDAVDGVTNFFRRIRIFFLRTLDLKNILKPITSLFSGGAGVFQGLAKVLGGILKVFGKLFLPLTIIMGIFDGIMGAIEGFEEGGIVGAIKGALVGIVDGAIGWLVGIGQWIVSNLLEMLGFDDLAKIVEEFNFKEFLKNFAGFLFPIVGILELFDENSSMRKAISEGFQKIQEIAEPIISFFKNWGAFALFDENSPLRKAIAEGVQKIQKIAEPVISFFKNWSVFALFDENSSLRRKMSEGAETLKQISENIIGFYKNWSIFALFDENSAMRKKMAEGAQKLANVGENISNFYEGIWESVSGWFGGMIDSVKTKIEEFSFVDLLEQLWAAIKEWILDAPAKLLAGFKETGSDILEWAKNKAAEIKGDKETEVATAPAPAPSPATTSSPMPAPSPQERNKQELERQTEQNKDLAAAPPKPVQSISPTVVSVDRSTQQAVTYNKEMHASKHRGSPGMATASSY